MIVDLIIKSLSQFRTRHTIAFLIFATSGLHTVSNAAFPDSHGIFYIRNFTNSHLIWQPLDQSAAVDLGSLGTTANRVKCSEEYVIVVHSGGFQTGSGSALWYATVIEVTQAIQLQRVIQWTTCTFPAFSNAYDVAIVGDTAWVTLLGSSQIAGVRLSTNQQFATVNTASYPQDVLLANRQLYVSGSGFGSGRYVARHNPITGLLIDSIAVGTNPQGLCVYDENIYVACSGTSWTQPPIAGNCTIIHPTGLTTSIIHPTITAHPFSITATTSGRIVLIDSNEPRVFQIEQTQPGDYRLIVPAAVVADWNVVATVQDSLVVSSLQLDVLNVFDSDWNPGQSYSTSGNAAAMEFWQGRNNTVSEQRSHVPNNTVLQTVYPNPFNSSTNILLRLPHSESGTLTIFDRSGREIQRNVVHGNGSGNTRITIRLNDKASGTYFAQWIGKGSQETIPLELVK
ncbi:MAG: T9SS type A sorting domain-containing protein [bacterium]|nr:T9SS type A sorting domain-containing protein [bacterium]